MLVLDDGTSIAESDVIVEYLEDAYPSPAVPARSRSGGSEALRPPDPESYVMGAIGPLFTLYDAKDKAISSITGPPPLN